MRRWLAILLLVLLPVQFTWAMVADYCAHEPDATAAHFGHHDHQSHGHAAFDADPVDQATPDDPASSVPQVDCGHCHGHTVGMFDAPAPLTGQGFSDASPPSIDAHRAEHLPAQPERPQWAALA